MLFRYDSDLRQFDSRPAGAGWHDSICVCARLACDHFPAATACVRKNCLPSMPLICRSEPGSRIAAECCKGHVDSRAHAVADMWVRQHASSSSVCYKSRRTNGITRDIKPGDKACKGHTPAIVCGLHVVLPETHYSNPFQQHMLSTTSELNRLLQDAC